MSITIKDLEEMSQSYPIEMAVRLSIADIPEENPEISDIEYISMQLNSKNPIDSIILSGLLPYKANGKSVSGLVRLLLYHYFTHTLSKE